MMLSDTKTRPGVLLKIILADTTYYYLLCIVEKENGSEISNNEISLPLLVMVRTFLIKASFLAVV